VPFATKELAFQNGRMKKRADVIGLGQQELALSNIWRSKRGPTIGPVPTKSLLSHDVGSKKRSGRNWISLPTQELSFKIARKKRAVRIGPVAKQRTILSNSEKQIRADELTIANKELFLSK